MFKTVGDLRKALDGVSDDTPLNPVGDTNDPDVTIEDIAFIIENGKCNVVAEVISDKDSEFLFDSYERVYG